MTSSLILKKLVTPNLLGRSLRPVVAVAHPAAARRFNTNALPEYDGDDRDADVDRRDDRRVFSLFVDIYGPYSSRNSLNQLLNMVDQFLESPISSSIRSNWHAREADDGFHLRLEMPGLSKDDVKVSVEQNNLIIRGEGKKDLEDDDSGRRYSSRIDLPDKLYKTNEIKAEMKNGILKVFVPKIKEEERNDVYHVNVE